MTCVLAQAKKVGRDVETVVLLVAGNDTEDRGNNPADTQWEMNVRPPRFFRSRCTVSVFVRSRYIAAAVLVPCNI